MGFLLAVCGILLASVVPASANSGDGGQVAASEVQSITPDSGNCWHESDFIRACEGGFGSGDWVGSYSFIRVINGFAGTWWFCVRPQGTSGCHYVTIPSGGNNLYDRGTHSVTPLNPLE